MSEEGSFYKFAKLDKAELAERFGRELPELLERLNLSVDRLSSISDIDSERLLSVCNGKSVLQWNEYLSVLFILLRDSRGKELIERRALFPNELKEALSINKNEHN